MKKIRKFGLELIKNQLVTGSMVVLAGSLLGSFINYLYHLLMGRMLGPLDYGVLASLISISYWLGIPMAVVSLVIVKYVSAFRAKENIDVVSLFYNWVNKISVYFIIVMFLLMAVLTPWLKSFLHFDSSLPYWLIVLSSLIGVGSTVNQATLQGFLRFNWNVLMGIFSSVAKLLLGVALVYLGLKVLGGIGAILISALVGYFFSVIYVKKLVGGEKKAYRPDIPEILKFALPSFFSILAFTSLYTSDIVLARHFLPAREAGYYAALANLGKIVFFASAPIATVMFPMISERHAGGRRFKKVFIFSFLMVMVICSGVTFIYLLFPELMVKILYGKEYLLASAHLWRFAIFLSFYSLCSLLSNFFLSIKKVKAVVLPAIASLLQLILIFFFHRDLEEIVSVSILVLGLLLISLLLYLFLIYEPIKKALAFGHRSRL